MVTVGECERCCLCLEWWTKIAHTQMRNTEPMKILDTIRVVFDDWEVFVRDVGNLGKGFTVGIRLLIDRHEPECNSQISATIRNEYRNKSFSLVYIQEQHQVDELATQVLPNSISEEYI
jgi:hypothetical protein